MTPEISQKIMQMLDAIQTQIEPAAKATLTLALQVVQINALGNILYGVAGALVLIVNGFLVKLMWEAKRKFDAKNKDSYRTFDDEIWPLFTGFALIITSLIALVVIGCNWLDIYNWVGIFNPKIYLAHQIMQKFIGG